MAYRKTDGDRPAPQRRAVTVATTLTALVCLAASACGTDTATTADTGAGTNADGAPTPPSATNGQSSPSGAATTPDAASDPSRSPASSAVVPSADLADPATVAVPALDIRTDLEPLAVDDQNVLVPPDYGVAGWWKAGPEPGEPGAAVIAGHVDNVDGPDVFARLSQAEVEDSVIIELTDGSRVVFTVVDVEQYPQREFPTDLVYGGNNDRPLLRLITCGGEYDRDAGRYRDNVVVFAEPRH